MNETKYSSNKGVVSITKGNRSSIQKTNVPKEIWNKYSKNTTYEVLNIRPVK